MYHKPLGCSRMGSKFSRKQGGFFFYMRSHNPSQFSSCTEQNAWSAPIWVNTPSAVTHGFLKLIVFLHIWYLRSCWKTLKLFVGQNCISACTADQHPLHIHNVLSRQTNESLFMHTKEPIWITFCPHNETEKSLLCDIIGAWISNQEERHVWVSQPWKLLMEAEQPWLSAITKQDSNSKETQKA